MTIDHPPPNSLEYNLIIDGIYIGTNECCQTHFDEKLKQEGIDADISLEENRVDAPFGVNFYVWIPVKNHMPPTPDQLEFGVSVLKKIVAMGKKIYVHCQNGHGRAPTLVAAYLIKSGKTVEEAINLIKNKRPSIHLQEKQIQALHNFARDISKNKNYTFLFLALFFVFFALFVLIPVWTVPGNTLAVQLDIFTPRDYAVLVLLSFLSSLFITMQIYVMRHKRKIEGVSTVAAGGLGALFAGIAGTAFCASCLAPLFALFGIGFGGVIFVLEYRIYFVAGVTILMLIAIYLTARKINKVCTSC